MLRIYLLTLFFFLPSKRQRWYVHASPVGLTEKKESFFFSPLPWVARLTICFLSVKKSTPTIYVSPEALVNFYFWNIRHKEKNFRERMKWLYRLVTKRDKIVVSFLNINRTWANFAFDKESKKKTHEWHEVIIKASTNASNACARRRQSKHGRSCALQIGWSSLSRPLPPLPLLLLLLLPVVPFRRTIQFVLRDKRYGADERDKWKFHGD